MIPRILYKAIPQVLEFTEMRSSSPTKFALSEDEVNKEAEAIKKMWDALQPLAHPSRVRMINWAHHWIYDEAGTDDD